MIILVNRKWKGGKIMPLYSVGEIILIIKNSTFHTYAILSAAARSIKGKTVS